MVTGNGVTITNKGGAATINSGNPIWLVDARITKQWKNQNNVDFVGGKFDCVEARQGGSENPKLTVEGFIDIHDTAGSHTINGDSNCTKVTEAWLISMSCLKQSASSYLQLKSMYGTSSTSILGRNTSSGYPANTTTINVVIEDWNINIPSDSYKNHMWSYSINMTETGNVS